MQTVNNKIQWTSHSSFVHITCGNIKMASNVHREVDEVREERLRGEHDKFRRERNYSEERYARSVNLWPILSLIALLFFLMAITMYKVPTGRI